MISKYVLVIAEGSAEFAIDDLLEKNDELHQTLTTYKNKITEYYKNKLWDRYKKLTNEYEMIFTTPNTGCNISAYVPVSRSFFKMWEMLHDFREELSLDKPKLNVIFLAEGPGGFAEAFFKYRDSFEDEYYGISLKSNNKNIPEWKFQNRVQICYGKDGTGDLYKKSNLDYLRDTLPKMDVITADGGFDFSSDFNNQEELSLRLILCEIYAAIQMQAIGGHFILKIYDIFNTYTIKTICLLKKYYKTIYVVKPLSSRPANSEKYLVCADFAGKDDVLDELIANYNFANLRAFFHKIPYISSVLHDIVCYNVYYTFRQVYYIEETIRYITDFGKNFFDDKIKEKLNKIQVKHRQKAIDWCIKYNLEYSA